jgi:hypothetical protein
LIHAAANFLTKLNTPRPPFNSRHLPQTLL